MRRPRQPAARPIAPHDEWLVFTAPVSPDFLEIPVSLGITFNVTAVGLWIGNYVTIPLTLPGIATSVQAYDGGGGQVANKAFAPAIGTLQPVLFDAGVPVTPGPLYTAAWYTDRYAASNGYAWPVASAGGHVVTPAGTPARFLAGGAPARPTNASATNYYVTPIVRF